MNTVAGNELRVLSVYLDDRHVGTLWLEDDAPVMGFEYAKTSPPALSLSLPVSVTPYRGTPVSHWFTGLLPEAEARQEVARQHRLAINDDFGLLRAIGRECAGAVSILPPDQTPADLETGVDLLSEVDLARWIRSSPRGSVVPGERPRLSLAGAQDKLAVVLQADLSLGLTRPGTPTTHILKPPSPGDRYPGIVELEALGMRLAAAAGLPVAPVQLRRVPEAGVVLLVERYDRVAGPDGRIVRVHQEDVAQALGIAPELKYHSEGGIGIPECVSLFRQRLAAGAPAIVAVIDWAVFNASIGNADAHAKNISVLYPIGGRPTLAPFYDLVPTSLYPSLNRGLAMPLGATTTLDEVTGATWDAFGRACGVKSPYIRKRVQKVCSALLAALDPVVDRLVAEGGSERVLRAAAVALRDRVAEVREGRPPSGTGLREFRAVEHQAGGWERG